MKWQDEVVAIMKPFTSQHYIGETDIVQDPSRAQGVLFSREMEAARGNSRQVRSPGRLLRISRRNRQGLIDI